ncbi:MAG: hypothetical protein Q7S74_03365 [Nanoarchaeota archaeon]|nr:hypothetical protein [Nanoarchaeota archaeon]
MVQIKKEGIIITPSDLKPSSTEFEIIGTVNPAAIRLPNNDIMLYVRVIEKLIKDEDENNVYSPRMIGKSEFKYILDKFPKKNIVEKNPLDIIFPNGEKRLTFISHLRRVILDSTGLKIKSIDNKPSFFGLSSDGELGIEDPRIVKINDLYVMTYVSLARETNVCTSLALSKDLKTWQRKGIIFEEQNKDVVIFPELINNKYVSLNRPEGSFEFKLPHIWISYSKDLEGWGKSKSIILSENDWDSDKVGAGPPPIKTKKGWLLLYHAAIEKQDKNSFLVKTLMNLFGLEDIKVIYSVGAALLSLDDPSKIISKTKNPLFTPRRKYEKGVLEKKKVIFPTGIILDRNKDLLIYAGAGDVVTEVKVVSLDEVMKHLERV